MKPSGLRGDNSESERATTREEGEEKREERREMVRSQKGGMVEKRVGHGEAQGRVDWKRDGWPDAKFAVRSANCGLRTDQQREKREESRARREKREESREG